MPMYDWKCDKCEARTTVHRRMIHYDRGPAEPCQGCGSTIFTKMVNTEALISVNPADKHFPVRVPNLQKVVHITNEQTGEGYVEYKDVVFQNRNEQKEWLKENNMCLTGEGRDSGIGASQHSVYDAYDPPPPSDSAVEVLKNMHYVEPSETKYLFDEGPALDEYGHPKTEGSQSHASC